MISPRLHKNSVAGMPSKLGIAGETYSLITKSFIPQIISVLPLVFHHPTSGEFIFPIHYLIGLSKGDVV